MTRESSDSGAAVDPLIGALLAGKYFVHHLLGRGGMADVYKATWLDADRPVAVKILRGSPTADPLLACRFEREAHAASLLRHPHSTEILDFGTGDDGSLYMAMELVPGRTLARVVSEEAPLDPPRAVHVAAQVLEALAAAHLHGIIHRDLKPANVMVAQRDGADFVKVLDFGIAILAEQADAEARLTQHGMVYGTPAYMSPEQIRGDPVDARSDLYAVAAMLFEMLTGAPPFSAATPLALAAKHLTEPAPAVDRGAAIPPALAAVVARALEKDPAQRPASADAMRRDLLASLGPQPGPTPAAFRRDVPPTEAFPAGASEEPRHGRAAVPGRWRRAAFAASAIAVVAGTAVGQWSPWSRANSGGEILSSTAAPPDPAPHATHPPAPAPAAPERGPTPQPSQQRTVARVPRERTERAAAASESPAAAAPVIRLVRGELNSVTTPPSASHDGVLVLQATPWAEVSIEGHLLGETPREVRLASGSYRVTAVHPTLGVREGKVVVAAGERKLWTANFAP
jgi:serine/threonine-protein kinase